MRPRNDSFDSFFIWEKYVLKICNKINKDTKASFYLSPCFGKVTLTRLPEFIMKHADKNIRAQIQIHKIFWDPKEKDV